MLDQLEIIPALASAFAEQKQIMETFGEISGRLLKGHVPMTELPEELCRFERSFFSSLFLAALAAVGMGPEKRLFYGLINQCMRAWVTGCDNLLDDEDRTMFPIDLPGGGYRFKAVLTIMTADRILGECLLRAVVDGQMTEEQALQLQRESLACLVPSGIQEHAEEDGVFEALPPDRLLREIHSVKTGRLFEAPLIVPEMLGEISGASVDAARRGLHSFGLGCQIIDDKADIILDLKQSRHNYVVSVLAHGPDNVSLAELRARAENEQDLVACTLDAQKQAERDAREHLLAGLGLLCEAGLVLTGEQVRMIAAAMFPLLLLKDACPPK